MHLALLFTLVFAYWESLGPRNAYTTRLVAGSGSHPRLYVVGFTGGNGIFRSDDGGSSWRRTESPPFAEGIIAIAVDPYDPDRIFAADLHYGFSGYSSSAYLSIDGGATWTEKLYLRGTTACGIAFDPVVPGTVYVSFDDIPWLFRSEDGGETFIGLPAPDAGAFLATAADGTVIAANGPISFSRDRGRSWSLAAPPHQPCPIRAIAADPVDPQRWYVGFGADIACGSVSRTDDGGASWTVVVDPGGPVNSIATQAGVVYISVGPTVPSPKRFRVLASMDGGATWIDLDGPVPGVGSLAVSDDGSHIYASTGAGVYRRDLRLPRTVPPR